MKPSKKSMDISSFLVMDIMEMAAEISREGRDVINFSVGEPDFNTPRVIREAGIRAIRQGKTKYTHSLGTPELREAICGHYKKEYKLKLEPDRVMVCNGSSAALFTVFASLLDPGDEVILGNPYYACYPNFITFLSGVPVYVPLSAVDGFRLPPEAVREKLSHKTKAILVNSPANPTGAVMTPAMLEEIAGMGHTVISDEIYHGLTYGRKARTVLEFTENAFVLGGFSKRYAMTGWRVGYAIAPKEFIRPMQKLQQNFQISPSAITQEAAVAALRFGKADAEKMKKEFHKRRDVMIKGLRSIGFEVKSLPEGAFYVFVSCSFIDSDSYRLAVSILRETGVAVTPGVDFGSGGEHHLRFSYATSTGRIREGIRRLGRFLEK
ncbi:MAG: pyridoxal phosphate-dependent aminotransferase [Nitrospinota bacterium]